METEVIDSLDKGGGALRTIKDLAAGAAGGMAQVLLGMCTLLCLIPGKSHGHHEMRILP